MSGKDQRAEITSGFLIVHRYRHLLGHLAKRSSKNSSNQPIKTPRDAAILARLWVTQDLDLPNVHQTELGRDLDISPSDIGGRLNAFLDAGLVIMNSADRRSKCYQITDRGKSELEKWLQDWYSPRHYHEILVKIQPDMRKVSQLSEVLKDQIKTLLLQSPE